MPRKSTTQAEQNENPRLYCSMTSSSCPNFDRFVRMDKSVKELNSPNIWIANASEILKIKIGARAEISSVYFTENFRFDGVPTAS